MPDDTIHEGEWVKVKCWACEGRRKSSLPSEYFQGKPIAFYSCDTCSGRGWLMQFLGLKPAPAPVKEGAD